MVANFVIKIKLKSKMAFGFTRNVMLRIHSPSVWCGKGPWARFYSVFAPDFEEPVLNQDEIINILKSKSAKEILSVRRKPTPSSYSYSANYHPDVNLFINYIMKDGKKEVAENLVNKTFTRVKHIQLRKYHEETDKENKEKILINPLDVFLEAVKNTTPMMWFVKIRKSGSWFKIPIGITEINARKRAMKWLIEAGNEKNSKILFEVEMANELIAASNHTGKAVLKKLELHKMCEANRGYMHYWWT